MVPVYVFVLLVDTNLRVGTLNVKVLFSSFIDLYIPGTHVSDVRAILCPVSGIRSTHDGTGKSTS